MVPNRADRSVRSNLFDLDRTSHRVGNEPSEPSIRFFRLVVHEHGSMLLALQASRAEQRPIVLARKGVEVARSARRIYVGSRNAVDL